MAGSERTGQIWSEEEIRLILAEYFEMLRLELSRKPFVKIEINRKIQQQTGRSKSSIEFKNRNISAVLRKLGLPWIKGYFPAENYQDALTLGIGRIVDIMDLESQIITEPLTGLVEASPIFFEKPPSVSGSSDKLPKSLERLVRKFDVAQRDERNIILGRLGEKRILDNEINRLEEADLPNLARKVRWVSEEDGDGAGYDILSFDFRGKERLLEVKTTNGYQRTPFYISRNEYALSAERPDVFRLVRLYDFVRDPKGFEIAPPLEMSVMLQPEIYKASFT